MIFFHLADLHLGKRLKDFSLIDDQRAMLLSVLSYIDELKPDAVVLAGDIYDKSIPSLEAINLFDEFLTKISQRKIPVLIISGNHDSQDRMTFGSTLMKQSGIYFSQSYKSFDADAKISAVQLQDEYGPVNFYLLPFVRPVEKSYTQAMKEAIQKMDINTNERNILVAHQLVTGSERSDSEDISIGTLEDVDVSVFESFDYVALGHIHKPQKCSSEKVWYSGSPLKYSFSEVNHEKGLNLVELKKKGELCVQRKKIEPIRDLHEIKGEFQQITSKDYYEKLNLNDFYKIILTDEDDVIDGFGRLQKIYKNLIFLDYENTRTKRLEKINAMTDIEKINPLEIFKELYSLQNNASMTKEQEEFSKKLIEEIWRGE